jgi:tRNA (cytidine/uridine-2'-O-)-methyltransferase
MKFAKLMDVTVERGPKLRFRPLRTPVKIVLIEPEIPQNTGSVARTCAAAGLSLHLVGKLGFRIDEHAVKRAGLDYWDKVRVFRHESFERYLEEACAGRVLLFSSRARRSYTQAPYEEGCSLVFGKETAGLPDALLAMYPDDVYGIPTLPAIRSLNLSNAVSVVAYECLRKLGALDTVYVEP